MHGAPRRTGRRRMLHSSMVLFAPRSRINTRGNTDRTSIVNYAFSAPLDRRRYCEWSLLFPLFTAVKTNVARHVRTVGGKSLKCYKEHSYSQRFPCSISKIWITHSDCVAKKTICYDKVAASAFENSREKFVQGKTLSTDNYLKVALFFKFNRSK